MTSTKQHRQQLNRERKKLIRDKAVCGYQERPLKIIGQIEMRVAELNFWRKRGFGSVPYGV